MKKLYKGDIIPALLIITGAFFVVIYGLILVLTTQLDFSHRQVGSEMALNMAEAGVNYYRWHLAHDPLDFKDGTGTSGPYIHTYTDPQGKDTGKFSLNIFPPTAGSSIVTIESTGWSNQFPNVKRTIKAQYGKASLAKFSFLQHAASWYGQGITVNGAIQSNTGIRMDGENTSTVSSAQSTYTCGVETGCNNPTQMPGVWGSGSGHALWTYPVDPVNFGLIAFDFDSMKTAANNSGLYLDKSNKKGYHIIFNSNGTYTVRKVNNTSNITAYTPEDGCISTPQTITNESNVGTYNISNKPIIFAEDHLWVEGTIKGNVTIVAARFPLDSNYMNIWINNNLQYAAYDNTNSLGLIAQQDIYFVRNLPNDFKVDGALIAQKGKIIRHGYISGCGSSSFSVRNSLTINGSIISFNKSYWNFGSQPVSGFNTRTINYDAHLLYQPPPYFPTSGDYEFISWTEE